MADIGIRSTWMMGLETHELRLVLKALGGRLSEDEVEPARQLGDRLTRMRAEASKHAMKQADELLAKVPS